VTRPGWNPHRERVEAGIPKGARWGAAVEQGRVELTMRQVVLDCDPGLDDAIAILLLLSRSEWAPQGISVVAGNTTLDHSVRNTLQVLTLAGRDDVPVYAGMDRPLLRPPRTAESMHGKSGLGDVSLPDPEAVQREEHAVSWLIRRLRAEPMAIEVIATGPLTNLAAALRQAPDLIGSIRRLVVMGGAIAGGNVTPSAEFNVFSDPEAAAVVFDAGLPVTMIGLDVTHQAALPKHVLDRIRALGGRVAEAAADLLAAHAGFYEQNPAQAASLPLPGSVPTHDALAVAAALEPGIVRTRRMRVDVETCGRFTEGRTVCDVHGVTGRAPNVDVAVDVDPARFHELLVESLGRYASRESSMV
jgi:inosine-uridine nucleoside N-ribohydrolase